MSRKSGYRFSDRDMRQTTCARNAPQMGVSRRLMTNLNAKATRAGVALLAFAWLSAAAAATRTAIPLPRPRPAEAPRAEPRAADKKEEAAAPEPPQPSACRQALTEDIAIAPSLPPIKGPGGCGGDDLV